MTSHTLALAALLLAPSLAFSSSNIIRLQAPIQQSNEAWVSAPDVVSDWSLVEGSRSCSAWSPDAASVESSTTVTQTSTRNYEEGRSVQAMERNTSTGELRPKGDANSEKQAASEVMTRTVHGEMEGQVYQIQVGQHGKSSNKYWGYMDDGF